jgi:two-component system response regulator
MSEGRPAEILLVEDNEDDVELMRIGFERARFAVNLHHVPHGEACMEFLRNQGSYAQKPRPDLVLLDLNMPRMNGLEFLREVRADPSLAATAVVVLTTSQAEQDVAEAHRLNVAGYFLKPVELAEFVRVIATLDDYWMLVEMT